MLKLKEYIETSMLLESTNIQKKLESMLRPNLVKEVMTLLNNNHNSPLTKYIIKRAMNKNVKNEILKIDKVSTLDAYNLDPNLFEQLMQVKVGDVGPGEVLISLTNGVWKGGTGGDYDVLVDNVGPTEVKYLGPFAYSTNVPMGSAMKKTLFDTELLNMLNAIGSYVESNLNILNNLNNKEKKYFIENTLDQLLNKNESLSTNSFRLIGRLLQKSKIKNISFEKFKNEMENTIKSSLGDSEYIMFLGEQTDPKNEGNILKGRYYILPKNKIRYYMFYRIYNGERIKIAPFTTEKDFYEKSINESEELLEMPSYMKYDEYDLDMRNWDPEHFINNNQSSSYIIWQKDDLRIEVVSEYGSHLIYKLYKDDDLVSAMDILNDSKEFDKPVAQIKGVATKEKYRGKGYAKLLYKIVLDSHSILASDYEIYENAWNIWKKYLPNIAYVYTYDADKREFYEFNSEPKKTGSEHILFVAFNKNYPSYKLPEVKNEL